MEELYMIHLDDYVRHIDDKMTMYSMLHQLEHFISKLPACRATAQVRKSMAAYSPALQELWDSWNIPKSYLVSGELDELSDLMDDELTEPEDAGYFCGDGGIRAGEDVPSVPELTDHALLLELTDTADKLYDNYAALVELARKQLRRCDQ